MSTHEKTLIFIPTYDERENVGPMAEQLAALPIEADILFCDDASPDGTGKILDALALKYPRLSVMHRTGKLGIGSAHMEGIAYAYRHGYQRLITMDCDFTHSPSVIPQLLEAAKHADLAVGNRFLKPDSLPDWNLLRRGATHLGHLLTHSMLGMSSDATGAFRVYRLDTIPERMFSLIHERGYAFFFESMRVFYVNALRIADVPIVLPARTAGHSKMAAKDVARSITRLMRSFLERHADPGRYRLEATDSLLPESQGERTESNSPWLGYAFDVAARLYRERSNTAELLRVLQREFPADASLLFAGCGAGGVDGAVKRFGSITAVDSSQKVLKRYEKHNPGARVLPGADFAALPFSAASFDGLYSLGLPGYYDEAALAKVFREFARVLKPKGKIVFLWPHKLATGKVKSPAERRTPAQEQSVRAKLRRKLEALLAGSGFRVTRYSHLSRELFFQASVVEGVGV